MCGIAGAFWTGVRPIEAAGIVAQMTEALWHRGPDSDGCSTSDFADVGFRRLAIIDIAGGDQPLKNEDGSIECFLNGEIYNYRELRSELKQRGHQFYSDSDTEVLPHLYEEFGPSMFRRLNGMFAICVVDRIAREITLARDHFGVKQIYYVTTPAGVVFASEVKGLLASGLFEPRLNTQAILSYLTLFYCPGPDTLVEGVRKLPPAHYLTVSAPSGIRVERYYRLEAGRPARFDIHQAAEQTGVLLTQAVERQLHADVPVGVSLSGGLDSSAIALLSARSRDATRPLALTISWPETSKEELQSAAELCYAVGLEHEVIEPATDDPLTELDHLAWMSDEPIADPALYSQFCVARAARPRVKVLLSGAGGDELFGGYHSYSLSWKRTMYSQLPRMLQRALHAILPRNLIGAQEAAALAEYQNSRFLWHCGAMSNLSAQRIAELREYLGESNSPFAHFQWNFDSVSELDGATQQMLVDLSTYLPDQVLPMLDRATMAASIEGRVPFLDVPLVEFAFSLPGEAKIGMTGPGKRVLKQFLADQLPATIIRRRKSGMPSPFRRLIVDRGDAIRSILLSSDSLVRTLVPESWLSNLMTSADARYSEFRVLYALLLLEMWHQRFFRERRNLSRVFDRDNSSCRDSVTVNRSA